VIFTGIGGQGIQLMAKVLAEAAVADGRHVMLFGSYQGMMRGGPSESTVVIADSEIQAPPIVPHCWALVAMHPEGLDAFLRKLRPNGLLLTNETLVKTAAPPHVRSIPVPATRLAEHAGNVSAASMIALGAFVAATELVSFDAVVGAMQRALPPHRRQRAEENVRLLFLGAEHVRGHARADRPDPAPGVA